MKRDLKKETRKDYLFRVALAYLKKIEESEFADALGITLRYDDAECDGNCLIEDMQNCQELNKGSEIERI